MATGRRIRTFLVSAFVIVVAGIATYWIKSAAIEKQRLLNALNAQIETENDRIMVLEADWHYLTRPDRIRRLSEDMLSFAPVPPQRILTLEHLDRTPPAGSGSGSAGLYRITTGQ